MKDLLNKENITALAIVVVGVIVASVVAPAFQRFVGKFTKKTA